jgi:anti-sigma B factor antagonist
LSEQLSRVERKSVPFSQAKFSLATLDGAAVLSVSGELDIANKETLELALHGGLAQNSGKFIADLLDATYADSACIHALLHADLTAKRMRKHLIVVIGGDGALQKIFRIAGLHQTITIRHSIEAALAARDGEASA